MADGRGQGIRGIKRHAVIFQVKQDLDHSLDLVFLSLPVAGDCFLNLQGRILKKRAMPGGQGHQDRSPHLAQGNGRPDVTGIEGVLDGHFIRGKLFDDLFQLGPDFV